MLHGQETFLGSKTRASLIKVFESTSTLSSFLTALSHSRLTGPSGILRISLIVCGAGSHECTSLPLMGREKVASEAHARHSSKSFSATVLAQSFCHV